MGLEGGRGGRVDSPGQGRALCSAVAWLPTPGAHFCVGGMWGFGCVTEHVRACRKPGALRRQAEPQRRDWLRAQKSREAGGPGP